MNKPTVEYSAKRSGTLTEESSQSLRGNTKVDQFGVTGGNLHDSIAVGENKGVLCTSHNHGDTYSSWLSESEDCFGIGVPPPRFQSSIRTTTVVIDDFITWKPTFTSQDIPSYVDKEELVHKMMSRMNKQKALNLDVKSHRRDSFNKQESSDDEFYDCISTPSPIHPRLGFQQGLTEENVDGEVSHLVFKGEGAKTFPLLADVANTKEMGSFVRHLGSKRPSMADIAALLQKISLDEEGSTEEAAQFGIQTRKRTTSEHSDICLNAHGSKCVPPVDEAQPAWSLGQCSFDNTDFTLDLKNVTCRYRLIAKHSISDTVLIAEHFPKEIENLFFFLNEIYVEILTCPSQADLRSNDDYLTSININSVRVDLRNIKCRIIRSKTEQNVHKIVFIAEVSPNKLIQISGYLSDKLFEQKRNDPT